MLGITLSPAIAAFVLLGALLLDVDTPTSADRPVLPVRWPDGSSAGWATER